MAPSSSKVANEVLVCLGAVAKSHNFVVGTLAEATVEGNSCRYVMRAGLVFTATETCAEGKLPNLIKGPIRVAPDGDYLFFLDQDGKQHRARIVTRSSPPPPPPVSLPNVPAKG